VKLTGSFRIPGTESTSKNDAIAGIQEHLRGAASFAACGRGGVLFEHYPDVTDAGADIGELPGLTASFEVEGRCKIPGDPRGLLNRAFRVTEVVEDECGIECRFSDDLNHHVAVEQLTFQLMVKIAAKQISRRLFFHVGERTPVCKISRARSSDIS
jgi:hypothetical protein